MVQDSRPALRRMVRALWVFNWFNSCGFTELLPMVASRYDMERFGMIAVGSPRHADALFVAGYQTFKSLRFLQRIYQQMPDPKFVVALGSCPFSGGMYWDSYNTVKHLEDYLPVDLHIPGCPPRPEAIFHAVGLVMERLEGARG